MKFDCQTVFEEEECRQRVMKIFGNQETFILEKSLHVKYLTVSLQNQLPSGYVSLDASRPWLFFWILRSLSLLDSLPPPQSDLRNVIVNELLALQHPQGGFRGNHGQTAHLAATYAACAALHLLDAKDHIDKLSLRAFLVRLKQPVSGRFSIQPEGGEEDLRAAYCAVAVAHLCGLLPDLKLFDEKFCESVSKCQTFEGGLGAVPYAEAHGGYSFCGAAALGILNRLDLIDCKSLTAHIKRLQCPFTGGLRGRTNKLVDGCYSYWQSAAFLIAKRHLSDSDSGHLDLDWVALRRYILGACQDVKRGGLRDKPGKPADLYHTCYCLSGLWLADKHEQVDLQSVMLNVLL